VTSYRRLSRLILEIASDPFLGGELAFRDYRDAVRGRPDDFVRHHVAAISCLDAGWLVGVLWRDWGPVNGNG
jgi:hypothetical protein